MGLRHLLLGAAMAATMTAPASAATFVRVLAEWNNTHQEVESRTGGAVVSGVARADFNGAIASTADSPLESCGLDCGIAGDQRGTSLARAEADGTTGALRARAVTTPSTASLFEIGGSEAEATARITDSLVFTTPLTLNFDLDFSGMISEGGATGLNFQFGAPPFCFGEFCGEETLFAEFSAFLLHENDDPFEQGYVLQILTENGLEVVDSGDFFPNAYQFSVTLDPLYAIFGSATVFMQLRAFADIDENDFAQTIADNSAFVEIEGEYLSLNGYSYPGRPFVGGAVPEPGSWALLILGFATVGSALRRARRPAAC